ncbi:helix-turn-helix domain-containing protein [Paenibacillus puerhi]|uniref:helix-turn-helix domain-containing protein n=1 Tax=Paenibacillus puerhi TaxID=2692622 RepID=UPI001359869D|nr:helix-turn-helix domain-containing protein [Paenibacillus puerhi]
MKARQLPIRNLWQKRKSIVFAWLISYSAVLIVPVIMSIIVYMQSSHALKSEIHRANDSLLKQVRYTIDTQIDLMKRLNMEITWNAKLQSLMYSSKTANDAQLLAYQIVKDFRMNQTSYASIDEFYVTWDEGDAVLRPGNVRDRKTAFYTLHDTGDLRYEQWIDALQRSPHNEFTLLPHVNAGKRTSSIAYITRLPQGLNGKATGSVVVMTDLERVHKALEAFYLFQGSQFLLLNGAGEVLMSNLPANEMQLLLPEIQGGDEVVYKTSSEGNAELFYIQSAVSDLKYVLVIPSSLYWEKAEYVRAFAFISVLISLIGAGMLTRFFLRRHYTPIQQLMRTLFDQGTPQDERMMGNELHFIQHAVSNTRHEKDKMAQQLKHHHHVLRTNMLGRLLKGRLDTLISYEDAFATFGIELASNKFAVILMAIENQGTMYASVPGMDLNERRRLVQFIIANVVEELASQRGHTGYAVELDDMTACLINLEDGDMIERKEDLRWIGAEAQQFLTRFRMELTIAIGGVHETLSGVPQAYQEAMDAMEYKLVVGKQELIIYEDIRRDKENENEARAGYYYPLHVEQQLMNVIKAGNVAQAASIMTEVMERNTARPYVSLTWVRCLMFNLTATMIKAIHELGDSHNSILGDHTRWVDKIIACDTLAEMQAELQALLREVCAFAAAKLEDSQSKERNAALHRLLDRIRQHVEENYSDPELNVNNIGEHFELRGSYLSKLFKEQTGEGLLEYVAKHRIEQAKRLMRDKATSVAEIAAMVGYHEAATFIRVFKKYEGITPGRYKETQGAASS